MVFSVIHKIDCAQRALALLVARQSPQKKLGAFVSHVIGSLYYNLLTVAAADFHC